jgi:hypothetical protein
LWSSEEHDTAFNHHMPYGTTTAYAEGLKNANVERIACHDEVDREILCLLFEAGSSGLLPKGFCYLFG